MQISHSLTSMQTEMPKVTRNIEKKEEKEKKAVMREDYSKNATISNY